MRVQCEQRTQSKDGHLCKLPGKHEISPGKYLCAKHFKKWKEPKGWDICKLPEPNLQHLNPKQLQKLNKELYQRVGVGKEGGHIYVYCIPDEDVWLLKIGKTSRSLDERLKEWAKEHPLEELFSVEFPCDIDLAERIIHLYLDWARVYRYPLSSDEGLLFYDVWKSNHKPIIEGTSEPKEKLQNNRKHTEWFAVELKEAEEIIEAVLQYFIAEHKRA